MFDSTKTLAVFDLDGTILDTLPDLAAAVNHALSAHGLPSRPVDTIRSFISNGVRTLIARSMYVSQQTVDTATDIRKVIDDYTIADEELYNSVHAEFVRYYTSHSACLTHRYEGIPTVLERLKAAGMRLAVVTNKRDDVARTVITHYYPNIFEIVIGDREGHPRKPAPDSVLEVLARLNIPAREAVYIGDSNVDIETAANAGVDCIAVTWGYRSSDYLLEAGAKYIVTSPTDLIAALLPSGI